MAPNTGIVHGTKHLSCSWHRILVFIMAPEILVYFMTPNTGLVYGTKCWSCNWHQVLVLFMVPNTGLDFATMNLVMNHEHGLVLPMNDRDHTETNLSPKNYGLFTESVLTSLLPQYEVVL